MGADGGAAPPPLPDGPPPPLPQEPPPPLQQQQHAPAQAPPEQPGGGAGASSSAPRAAPPPDAKPSAEEAALLKEFFSEMKDVDRDNEVMRIMFAFKLNPYEKLNLRFTATPEEVRRQYRKLSLMVHPDKCKHEDASDAFDVLGAAQKELLNEEKREALWKVLDMAREEVRAQREKETKHDTTIELAALLHEKGKEGVREQYEETDEFHERWRLKARDMLAKSEWRRRKLTKRLKDETARVKEEVAEQRENAKRQREHDKEWASTRDSRVGTWRDYLKKGGSKVGGHIKPPKAKTHDEERLYVQRPVGEQHRPPPPKPAGPKKQKH
ncbi:spf31 [Scenedesmus sp. PABB004]|nr:spf31 [Scenedesmus sp. PABB004]